MLYLAKVNYTIYDKDLDDNDSAGNCGLFNYEECRIVKAKSKKKARAKLKKFYNKKTTESEKIGISHIRINKCLK